MKPNKFLNTFYLSISKGAAWYASWYATNINDDHHFF